MAEITKLLAIIGSAKAGTTALAHHLGNHPQACLSKSKEPRYFSTMAEQKWTGPRGDVFRRWIPTDLETYTAKFEDLSEGQWAIDGSTDYIWREETPNLLERFSEHCDLRVLCILRDPVERAVSEYNHTLRLKFETLSFKDSVLAEEKRRAEGWQPLFYHKRRSTVSADVRRYADRFGDRFMVLDYAELRDADAATRRVYDFLGVPHMPVEDMERLNESYIPRNAFAKSVLTSDLIKGVGRALLPTAIRRSIRKGLVANARDVVTVKPEERAWFRDLLADEIEACIREPMIPTQNWTCT
ncbi:sulfotransferase family protein [Primorskyibacter sedentarius]|uniref:Sulfotransferase family protein n=1 Tax=Primorskyibacter sedentarius TaxID=745311 RepID=A0A4R3J3Q4_9RHOB|nr:sulfotransferase [Primorskyibacter sedentarius]TCS59815.1 sulfotransferase family protein [Primorskyibacter sedentarius]